MRPLASTILLAAVLAGSPTPARGQAAGETPRPGSLAEPVEERPLSEAPRPGLLSFPRIQPGALGPAGWYLVPTLGVSGEFDDNLFLVSSGRQSDFITRISAGLELVVKSASMTTQLGFANDAEFFADHSDLDNVSARRRGAFDLKYIPTATTTVGLNALYTETETPSELRPETQIEMGRQKASLFRISPTGAHQFDRVTSGDASYAYERTTLSGGVTNDAHQTRVGLARQLTALDTATVAYRFSLFETEGADSVTAHAFTLGLRHQFAQNTVLTLEAGPRFSDGTVDPEVNASLTHRFKWATVSLAYVRTQTTLIGQAGTVTSETLSGSVGFEPFRNLQLGLGSFVGRTSAGGEEASADRTVYGLSAAASYPLATWISARAAYRFAIQDDGASTIRHNIFTLSLDMTYPIRVD